MFGSVFIIVTALAGFVVGAALVPEVESLIPTFTTGWSQHIPKGDQLLTINKNDGGHGTPEQNREYLWYQLQYPSSYHVFTPDMFDSYHLSGGDGFPRPLFFTKDPDLFAHPEAGRPDWLSNKGECIAVLHENIQKDIRIADNIDWWRKHTLGVNFRVVSDQEMHLGYFDYTVGRLEGDNHEGVILDAYLEIPQRVSYYFRTCGTTNESDFLKVLETFDIRPYRIQGG